MRRKRPKWIVIHRGELPPSDVTTHEGLTVTTVAKSVLHVMNKTGRLGLARQAIKDARKEGYIGAAEAKRLTRQLNEHHRGDGRMQGAEEHPNSVSAKRVERLEMTLARVAREQGLDQERLRRWVSFLALCGVLEHAVEKGVIPYTTHSPLNERVSERK
jgi:hypothetical protein